MSNKLLLLLTSFALALQQSVLAALSHRPSTDGTCPNNGSEQCNDGAPSSTDNRSTKADSSSSITALEDCALYLAESAVRSGYLGLFSGVDRQEGDLVSEPELLLPILDANKNEWSPWHDLVMGVDETYQPLWMESIFLNDLIVPGVASIIACSNKYSNVVPEQDGILVDSVGVHRSRNASAGSFSYLHNFAHRISRDVRAGEELAVPCTGADGEALTSGRQILSIDFLKEEAVCLIHRNHGINVKPSTIPGAGRGAFASQAVPEGGIISRSPVIHFDRSQVEILEQEAYSYDFDLLDVRRDHGIKYTDRVVRRQLLQNYCYGSQDSDVLLLPFGPGVNFINHGGQNEANVLLRWSTHRSKLGQAPHMKTLRPMALFSVPTFEEELLVIEFVALRDIVPGEEILLDYGGDWERAWDVHQEHWGHYSDDVSDEYVSAADFVRAHGDEPFRTPEEREENPYPDNLSTACFFTPLSSSEGGDDNVIKWSNEHYGCLRPCEIVSRTNFDDESNHFEYSVVVYESENWGIAIACSEISAPTNVEGIPSWAIQFVDSPYTSDVHLEDAFRHEIGLPEGFVPENWKSAEPEPMGEFLPTPLGPGEIDNIRWKETGDIVTPWAFRMGLTKSVRNVLLEYCEKMGIIDVLRHVTVEGNGLKPGEETTLQLDGDDWYLQRPDSYWHSNLHWLSPAANPAHENYLQALGVAGFDEMLQALGEYLDMDGLVAFHVTFIAVSEATKGYMHKDVDNTQAKTYNIIVPLILASETTPELDVQDINAPDDDRIWIGRYRYEYEIAALMGDGAMHGTSAVDYRKNKEMRLAATIYVADVNEANADRIMADYTQAYPPQDRELLMSWAGRHWKPDDPSAKLPKPPHDHILIRNGGHGTSRSLNGTEAGKENDFTNRHATSTSADSEDVAETVLATATD